MKDWSVGDAKQRLSTVLRASEAEPQRILNRNRPVAVVISVELFEELERWRSDRARRSLGQSFDEVREISREEGYSLEVGARQDRDSWTADHD